MRYFPIFMDLREQPVLLVGGGTVAERKIRLLLKAGAIVHVVAPSLSKAVESWKLSGKIRQIDTVWNEDQLEGMRLVFAATSDSALNLEVYAAAEHRGVPVNVVDDLPHCRFISPAIVDRSPVQVAISTGGTAPVLARKIRSWVERLLPAGLGRIATLAGRFRPHVKARLNGGSGRRFWEDLFSDEVLTNWSQYSESRIRSEMVRGLQTGEIRTKQGKVFLVGAGPGRAGLLTLRALELLGKADVILHDRLVPEEILDLARRDADRIFVGKQAGNHQCTQQEIHRIMLDQAAMGRIVVRLKGGDAFVFGRGGEEIEFLRKHGVEYEVVPGITAGIGCAAYAGIPLTHRDHAQVLTFVTGHFANRPEKGLIDWAAITGPGKTTVVYMGLGQSKAIRSGLIDAGISRATPVALICDGTRDTQQILEGTIENLPGLAQMANKGAPGLLVIGQLAALSSNLAWFNKEHSFRTAA